MNWFMPDNPMNDEMRAAEQSMVSAVRAFKEQDWVKAEQALIEAQERIGRLLRELESNKTTTSLLDK